MDRIIHTLSVKAIYGLLAAVLLCLVSINSSCKETPLPKETVEDFLSFDTVKAWDITTFAAGTSNPQIFYDSNGIEIDVLKFAKKVGVNTIRLRILTGNTQYPHATLQQLLNLSLKAKSEKIAVWLDFHYSDVWADPGNQTTPQMWSTLNFNQLSDSIRTYTESVVNRFTQQGTEPSIIQIGNEISPGMLWPLGKFNGKNEEALAVSQLFNAGATGAKKAAPHCKIMLHIAGSANTLSWISNIYQKANFHFDLWGFSYYGFWHGCATQPFMQTCEQISSQTNKAFVIAETAHPFTLDWLDQCHNTLGDPSQLCSGFIANPKDQLQWLTHVWSTGKQFSNFKGMSYWEPTWITQKNYTCDNQLFGGGSSWENLCLFDFNHKALPAAYFNWK